MSPHSYFTLLLLLQRVTVGNRGNGMFTITWHGIKGTYPHLSHSHNTHPVCTIFILVVHICMSILFIIYIETTDSWFNVNPLHGSSCQSFHGSSVISCPSCNSRLECVCVFVCY